MNHTYTRHCFRLSDNRHFVETRTITGVDVATSIGNGRGDRADFLELVNRWNRHGIGERMGHNGLIYVYVAEVTSR